LVGFIRFGTDFSENFYQVELPLQFTPYGSTAADVIWPEVNEMDIALDDLNKVKSTGIVNQSLNSIQYYEVVNGEVNPVEEFAPRTPGRPRIGIRGNPSLGSLRSVMLGIKNDDNLPARGEVWFDELRMAELNNNGGWASIVALDANMADFANISATG